MGKKKKFSDFTYGVGLEVKAESFKQVKDDLKLNLDNLQKMVKSYGKVLKINPDADLSELFDQVKKLKSITDGINSSDNSFGDFVDKGVLDRIAKLESSIDSIGIKSNEVKSNLSGLSDNINSATNSFKAAGEVKFPGTFDNLFGKDRSAEIKSIKDQIDQVEKISKQLSKMRFNIDDSTGNDLSQNSGLSESQIEEYEDLADRFINISNQLKSADLSELQNLTSEYKNVVDKMTGAFKNMSQDQFDDVYLTEYLKKIDQVIDNVKNKQKELIQASNSLQTEQEKYVSQLNNKSFSSKSLGTVQSFKNESGIENTIKVNIDPKINEATWANQINTALKNIETKLDPLEIKPTFSKSSKNLEKDIDGNLAKINHAINVDLKVTDNIEEFNKKINNIDQSIKNARTLLEKEGNFKLKFEYEEGGKFKDAAYKILNEFKKFELINVKFYLANSRTYLANLKGLREKTKKEMKDIPTTFTIGNEPELLTNIDSLRAKINEKIANIGVNLEIQNMPQFMAMSALMRDSIESYYNDNPIGAISGPIIEEPSIEPVTEEIVELSEKAQQAQDKINKFKSSIESLATSGVKSEEFLKLGDFDKNSKYIKGSRGKNGYLKQHLDKYNNLKDTVPTNDIKNKNKVIEKYGQTESGYNKWQADLALIDKYEERFNAVVQRQIQHQQELLNTAELRLEKEKQITSEKTKQTKTKINTSSDKSSNEQTSVIKTTIKDQQQLNETLQKRKEILVDLEKKGRNSSYFTALGRWDKETNSFKKDSEVNDLLDKYNQVRKDRRDKGLSSKQRTKEEYSLNSQLNVILREQKKHIQEIIAANEAELNSVKNISVEQQKINSSKRQSSKLKIDTKEANKNIDELNEKLLKAKKALNSLNNSKIKNKKDTYNFNTLLNTGIGDIKNRLGISGTKIDLKETVEWYYKLINNNAELENKINALNNTKTTSFSDLNNILTQKQQYEEQVKFNFEEIKRLKKVLKEIRTDQIIYAKSKISSYEKEIQQTKELLNLEKQQTGEDKKQAEQAVKSENNKNIKSSSKSKKTDNKNTNIQASDSSTDSKKNNKVTQRNQSASTVKLENTTLNYLAKDSSLQEIKGKIDTILQQLGRGIVVSDVDSKTDASQISSNNKNKKTTATVKNSDVTIKSAEIKSASIEAGDFESLYNDLQKTAKERLDSLPEYDKTKTRIVTDSAGTVKGATISYSSKDKKSGLVEHYKLIADKNKEIVKFVKDSSVITENIANYEKAINSATKAQNNLVVKYNKDIANLQKNLDPGANKTLAGTEFEDNLRSKISEIKLFVDELESFDDNNNRVLFSEEDLLEQQRLIESMLLDARTFVSESKNSKYAPITFDSKNVESQIERYNAQLNAFIEQTKRAGLYTGDFKNQLDALGEELSNVKVGKDLKAYQTNFAIAKSDFSSRRSYDKLYDDLANSSARMVRLNSQINSDSTGVNTKKQLEIELAQEQEIYSSILQQLKANEKLYDSNVSNLKINEAIKKTIQEINKIEAAQSDKKIEKQNNEIIKSVDTAEKKYKKMFYDASNSKIPLASSAIEELKQYESLLAQLQQKQKQISLNPELLSNAKYMDDFNSLVLQMDKVEKKFVNLQGSSEKFLSKIKNISKDIKPLKDSIDASNISQLSNEMQRFANEFGAGEAEFIRFGNNMKSAIYQIKDGKGHIQQLTVEYDKATNSLGRYVSGMGDAASKSQKFFNNIKHGFENVTRYLVSFGSVYQIFAMIRQGVTYVREIDLALTELKKVTNETEETYANFLKTGSKTSSVIGSTVKDFTNATADFARLGYSIEDASKIAETALIYKNVGDGFADINEASESVISTMKAFKIEATDTMGIVDRFNEVGNNFAISSKGIGDALQKSASALVEGGNTIDEAIALVTAANSVVQDPDVVGTALKTLSLRLRGAKVELEEAGEETDDMATSVSQLQQKLLALTGGKVDIMLDKNTFKNTTQILREMSAVWEDMTDIQQASALELMGGKRQANILSSIISNFQTVEDVIESSMNSSGSAIAENEKYLDSIQGKIDLFTNSLQTLWMNALNSDAVKLFVDLGTAAIKFVDAVGALPTAVGGFVAFKSILKTVKNDFESIDKVFQKTAEEAIEASTAETVASDISRTAKMKEATAVIGLNTAKKGSIATTIANTAATTADTAATIAATVATKALAIAKALLKGIALGAITMVTTAAFTALITAIDNLHKSQKELNESAQEVIDTYKSAKEELSKTKTTIDGLSEDFKNLSHGVDQFGNNISLSTAEYERYNEIVNQIADMFPEMVTGYTAEGNAILSCKGNVDALTEAYEAQAAAARQAAIAGSGDVFKTFKNNYNKDTLAFWQDSGIKQQKELAEQIVELYSQGDYDSLNKLFREGSLINDARYNELSDLLDSAGIEKNSIWKHNIYGDVADFILPVNLYGHIDEEQFEKEITKIQSFIKSSATKINTETTGLKSVIEAYIGENEDYKKLESTYKTFIDNIVNSLDAEFLDSFESEVDIYEWVRKNYIEPISDPKIHKEFTSAIEEMFNLQDKLDSGDISLNEYNNKIISFVDAINSLDIDDEAVKQLANVFGISADDVIAYSNEIDTLQNKINTLADQYNSKINGNIDYSKRPIITAEEMINAGWVDFDGEYATTYDSGYGIKDSIGKDYSIVITPIVTTPDGTEILSPKDLDDYVYNYLSGSDNIIEADKVENGGKGILINAAEGLWTDKQFEEFNDKIQEIKDEHLEFSLELQEKVGDSTSKVFNDQINAMIGNAKEILAKEDWSKLNTLSISDLRIIDGFEVPDGVTYSWDKLTQKIQEAKKEIGTGISFETYSALTESLDKYNEIFNQSSEIITKNTEVTQEYKDSLIELGIAEEDLNEYFYEGNDLVVKDADGLKKLLKQSKANIASNVKLAKSQAKLEYYDLYKQIRQLTGGKRIESQATLDQVNALYAQMGALERTIAKYSILEQKLLGAADAYDTFAEAQTIDEEIDYGSKAEEMVGAIAEAFNTSELGTEAAQAAITGMIPESVFEDCDTLEEKLDAIYKYFTTGTVSKLFTIEFDDEGAIQSIEMTKENLEAFVDEMAKTEVDLGKGIMGTVFEGSWDEGFELNDSITSLEQFAEACNMTEAAAFAFLTSLEKYDVSWLNGDFSTMMDKLMGDNLEYKIYNNINALAELEVQMANGKISAKEYAKQYAELSSSQEQNAQSARENIAAWRENEEQLSKAKEYLQKVSKALNELKDAGDGAVYEGKTYKEWQTELQKTEGECQKLIDKKSELEQPGELIFQVSLDEVQKELEILETELNAQGIDVKANIVWDEEKKEYIWVGTKFDENDPKKKAVEEYLALITEERNIEVMQGEEVPTVLDTLQEIAELLDNIYKLQVETDEAESSVNDFLKVYNEIKDKGVVVTLAGKISEGLSSLWKKVTGEDLKEDKSTTTSYATKKSSSYKKVRGYTRADGTAHANGSWGAPKTETALVGELGPEMLVRNGRWTTVGENGAEFTEVKRGDIIFNHKQTEDLLSKGYVTSRGKAYASGTAYARTYSIGGVNTYDKHYGTVYKDYGNNKNSSSKDAKDDFKEIFDWFEVRLEELNEDIDLMSAKLENAVSLKSKNNILDDMIGKNKELISDLEKGKKLYDNYAAELLKKVPKQYREAAKNGKIAIETFAGEADEAELEAIQNYREWAQKAADVRVQLQETRKQVAELAKQKFDNIAERYERNVGISDHIIQQYEDMVDLQEKMGNPISENYYNSMIAQNRQKLSRLETEKAELQKSLDESVRTGDVKKYSEEWWDMVNQIYEVDHAIDECTASFEEYQNAINEIHWNNFDELINRLGYLSDETQNLIDLMGKIEEPVIKPVGKYIKYKDGTEGTIKFWTEDDVKWSEEGLTQLGLYAQQMELAEYQSKKYKEEIAYLNKEYAAGKYSQTEYYEKLNELKNAQYDSIEAYYDARDAIKDLQEARVDMIKEGIEKEIDAYEELINKKKEELDAEKDLYDFQKSTREQQKNIADIQRKLTALSTDNSASAIAERKRLEAELVEAKQDLEDTYYDRSIDQRQEALDNELDSFQKEKEKEIEKWEEYLEDVEKVVADSLLTVQNNATTVYNTLSGKADEYGLTLSNAITEPWKNGEGAVASYNKVFGDSVSSTIGQLKLIEGEWDALIGKMDTAAKIEIANQKQEDRQIIAAEKAPTTASNTANKNSNSNTNTNTNKNTNNTNSNSGSGTIKTGGKINAGSAKIYDYKGDTTGEKQHYSKDPVYKVLKIDGSWLQVRYHKLSSGVSGWFKKGDVKAYAKGSKKINKDQFALIDELGEELILRPDGNGRLSFLEKGTGVVPADLTSNLMAWGELDPSVMLERNRPSVGMSPEIHNTEINIDCSVGELIHIDHCDQSTLPDVEKIVNKAIEKSNQKMNESLRRFVR